MDIAKFFDMKSSKKRVPSSEQSETGDEPSEICYIQCKR